MLRKYIYILCITYLLVSLGSCKKGFLEINPKGLLIAKKTSEYDLLLNGLYLVLIEPVSTPVMGDEVAGIDELFATDMQSLAHQKAFRWEDDFYLPEDKNSEYSLLSTQTYIYNKIINEVPSSEEGTEAEKARIKAEALAGRAWVNFTLANFYGRPYNEATAATDLGTPLIKEADISQTKYTRATVKEMYDLMVSDLTQAIPDLPIASNRIRMSKAAGEALLGKIYMYMGKFDLALPLLEASLKDLGTATMPVGLYDFNTELAPGGSFYPSDPLSGPPRDDPYKDKEILYLKGNTDNFYWYFRSALVLNPETMKLFSANDMRRMFMDSLVYESSKMYPSGMKRAYGRYYYNMGINVSDIHLLRAECKARLGDTGGAVTDMLAFRKNRMPEAEAIIAPGIAGDKIALTRFILEERIREFPITGERWFDMRRLSVDPVYKSTVGNRHYIYNLKGDITSSYTLKPERLTFRFPRYITDANPGMPQNP